MAVLLGTFLVVPPAEAHMSEIAAFGRLQDKLTRDRRRTVVAFAFAVIVFVVGAFLHSGFASWGA